MGFSITFKNIPVVHFQNDRVWPACSDILKELLLGTGHYLSPGGGGGGGVWVKKKVQFSLSPYPPFECYFTEVIPLITFDDFRDPPLHVFIFQANLSAPEPFPTPPPGDK